MASWLRRYTSLIWLPTLFLLGGALVACGGGDADQAESNTVPTVVAEEATSTSDNQAFATATPVLGEDAVQPGGQTGAVDRIAYVGEDDQIYTIDRDGGKQLQITKEGTYSWPTWSPDGGNLAISGIVRSSSGAPQIGLFLASASEEGKQLIFMNDPEVPALIASTLLHYTLWSPDSQRLAFIAQTRELGLTLFVDNPHDDWNPTLTLGGAPLYMSWAPNSEQLIVHRGINHFLVDAGTYPDANELSFDSGAYRAPAWSPDGGKVILARQDISGRDVLSFADEMIRNRQTIGVINGFTSFLWSPVGDFAAVTQTPSQDQFLYRGIILVSEEGDLDKTLTTNELMAFFWSPDGKKIMYATPPDDSGAMKWVLIDVATGTESELVEFIPSEEYFIMLAFFDQYAYSHSFWSPDSKSFVFVGITEVPAFSSLFEQQESQVYVMDVAGGEDVKELADATFAAWSFN